jgi:hypothetical protein
MTNSSDRAKLDQYLGQYALALQQAFAIVRNGGANTTGQNNNANGQGNTSGNQANGSNGQFGQANRSSAQQLATYLHMMRGLRDKIESVAGSASNTNFNNNGNNAGNGIPVTGGSSSNTGNQGNGNTTGTNNTGNNSTGNTNNGSNNTGSTTTGNTSNGNTSNGTNGSQTTNSNNNANGSNGGNQNIVSSSLQKDWGTQFRDLQAALRWYNKFRTQPGNLGNLARRDKTQQYLDQYAFALRQAYTIILRGTNAQGQNNSTNSQSNSSGQGNSSGQANGASGQFNSNLTPQQQLAMYLHMMRGLRDKLMGGSDSNSTTVP